MKARQPRAPVQVEVFLGPVMVGQLSSPRLLCTRGCLWLSLQFSFQIKAAGPCGGAALIPQESWAGWAAPCKGHVGLSPPAIFRSPGVLVALLVCSAHSCEEKGDPRCL